MDFKLVNHAVVRKDHDVGVSRCNEQVFDKVAALGGGTKSSFTASPLTLISGDRRPLDVAAVCNSNRDVFVGNQILNRELNAFIHDLGTTFIAKLFLDFFKFISDYASQRTLIAENLFQLRDKLNDPFILISNLLSLQS